MAAAINRPVGYQALFDFTSVAQAIGFARRHGFDFVELHLNNIGFYRELETTRKRRAFDILVHAADGFNLFTPSGPARQAAALYLEHQVSLAVRIGARCLTFHISNDVPFAISGVKHYMHQFYPGECRQWVRKALQQVTRFARGRINLCVENTAGYRHPFVQEAVDTLLGQGLNLTWDFGHTNCLSHKARQAEFAFFGKRRSFVRNCHLHDNDHRTDLHLAIGAGTVDFKRFLEILDGSNPYLTIETRPKRNVVRSLAVLRRLLSC